MPTAQPLLSVLTGAFYTCVPEDTPLLHANDAMAWRSYQAISTIRLLSNLHRDELKRHHLAFEKLKYVHLVVRSKTSGVDAYHL